MTKKRKVTCSRCGCIMKPDLTMKGLDSTSNKASTCSISFDNILCDCCKDDEFRFDESNNIVKKE